MFGAPFHNFKFRHLFVTSLVLILYDYLVKLQNSTPYSLRTHSLISLSLAHSSTVPASSWHMTKCFSLILQLLLLVTVAMMNYALSISLVLFLPLPSVLSQPSTIKYVHCD